MDYKFEYDRLLDILDIDEEEVRTVRKRAADLAEAADRWYAICDDNECDSGSMVPQVVEAVLERAPDVADLRSERDSFLDILGLTDHEWSCLGHEGRIALRQKIQRVRA